MLVLRQGVGGSQEVEFETGRRHGTSLPNVLGLNGSGRAQRGPTATISLSDCDDVDVLRVRRQGFEIFGIARDHGPAGLG